MRGAVGEGRVGCQGVGGGAGGGRSRKVAGSGVGQGGANVEDVEAVAGFLANVEAGTWKEGQGGKGCGEDGVRGRCRTGLKLGVRLLRRASGLPEQLGA